MLWVAGSVKHQRGCRALSAGPGSGVTGTRAVIQVGTAPRGPGLGSAGLRSSPPPRLLLVLEATPQTDTTRACRAHVDSPRCLAEAAAAPSPPRAQGRGQARAPGAAGCQPDSPATSLGSHGRPLWGPAGGWTMLATRPRGGHAQTAQPRDPPPAPRPSQRGGSPSGQRGMLPRAQDVPPPPPRAPRTPAGSGARLTVQVADLAVLDCWKVTSKWWGPG